jgi:streptogramin lyase
LRQDASLDVPKPDEPVGEADAHEAPPARDVSPPTRPPTSWRDRRPLANSNRRRTSVVATTVILLVAAIAAAAIALNGGAARRVVVASNTVGLVDADTNRLLARVAVGASPTRIVTGRGAVWVLNSADSTISRIDPRTHRVRTIGVPEIATDLAVGADVWVLSVAQTGAPDPFAGPAKLARIDPRLVDIVETRPVGAPGSNTLDDGVAVGGQSVWTSDPGVVTRFDTRSIRVLGHVSGIENVGPLAADRESAWAITRDGVVHVSDASRSKTDFRSGGDPAAIARADGAVWVVSGASSLPKGTSPQGTVTRIDTASETPTLTLTVPGWPVGIAVRGLTAWVATRDGRIVRIDRNRVASTIRVAKRLGGIAVDENGVWFTVPEA